MEKRTTSTVITIHDDTDSSSQELGVCGKLLTMIRRISSRQASPVMTPRGSSRSSHRNHSAVKFIDIVSGGSPPTTKASTTTNTVLVHNKLSRLLRLRIRWHQQGKTIINNNSIMGLRRKKVLRIIYRIIFTEQSL
ncbi:uncharacterized protein LOC133031922 [Cannabis sativa]|uniref:uncharacterized protein LOC133031922 n=1 Tax=Cannabis sativa TaxID=3483 RepID=UPI0029CA1A22|nr:uncharacterized protein LOC133031922 [Cannabis sativa]